MISNQNSNRHSIRIGFDKCKKAIWWIFFIDDQPINFEVLCCVVYLECENDFLMLSNFDVIFFMLCSNYDAMWQLESSSIRYLMEFVHSSKEWEKKEKIILRLCFHVFNSIFNDSIHKGPRNQTINWIPYFDSIIVDLKGNNRLIHLNISCHLATTTQRQLSKLSKIIGKSRMLNIVAESKITAENEDAGLKLDLCYFPKCFTLLLLVNFMEIINQWIFIVTSSISLCLVW